MYPLLLQLVRAGNHFHLSSAEAIQLRHHQFIAFHDGIQCRQLRSVFSLTLVLMVLKDDRATASFNAAT